MLVRPGTAIIIAHGRCGHGIIVAGDAKAIVIEAQRTKVGIDALPGSIVDV